MTNGSEFFPASSAIYRSGHSYFAHLQKHLHPSFSRRLIKTRLLLKVWQAIELIYMGLQPERFGRSIQAHLEVRKGSSQVTNDQARDVGSFREGGDVQPQLFSLGLGLHVVVGRQVPNAPKLTLHSCNQTEEHRRFHLISGYEQVGYPGSNIPQAPGGRARATGNG
mmetsp:Transcript_9455/g.40914  ORF Transcript_9455/g.40914 Transcript_9455/m.40914 type:complete len:166 (-) Transcript_9455:260-757(-)